MEDEEVVAEDDENIIKCAVCEIMAEHEVLRERKIGTGADFLVKCQECDGVHTIQFRPPKIIEIPIMLTEGPKSNIAQIEMEEDEHLALDDVFAHEEKHWRITRLENRKGKAVRHVAASNLSRATALRADQLRIKITMTDGEDSEADVIEVPAETIFSAGAIIRHHGEKWRIRAIHTGEARTLTGKVPAYYVKRLYLHLPPRDDYYPQPQTPRERRQAWKEGRLGDNPNPIDVKTQKRGSGSHHKGHRSNRHN